MRKNNHASNRKLERDSGDVLPGLRRAGGTLPRVPEFHYPIKWQDIARVNEEVAKLPPMQRVYVKFNPLRIVDERLETKSE